MFTRRFWRAAIERAVKTAAQADLLLIGANQAQWLAIDWGKVGATTLGGLVLSVLTSITSEPFGPADDPSAV